MMAKNTTSACDVGTETDAATSSMCDSSIVDSVQFLINNAYKFHATTIRHFQHHKLPSQRLESSHLKCAKLGTTPGT